MYNTCSPSSTGADHHLSSDEISLFLHQILLHSNNSTSSSSMTSSCSSFVAYSGPQTQSFAAPLSASVHPHRSSGSMVGLDSCDGVNVGFFSENVRGRTVANASSLSIGGTNSENETDECDCESEEGLEALVEEIPAKQTPPRSSSKRSRAAEVHNLSEKRRRSRINEKMKALQNLIPNSNKTDKASMLDEAIEYLKQLQLQVQMLSMRNGVSLHPMCLPGLLQPIQFSQFNRGFDEESGPQHMNITCSLPLNQENQEQIIFDLPNQCSVSNQLSVPNIINSETPFGVESSIRAHFGPFPPRTSSELKEICREDVLPHHQLSVDHSERTRSEFEMGVTATTPLHFETQASNLKDSSSLGTCMIGRDQSECMFLKNIEDNLIISANLQGMRTERSTSNDEIKIERQDI